MSMGESICFSHERRGTKIMTTIRITDLKLKTIIGTMKWERTTPQTVVINVAFQYNSHRAQKTDKITDAVDYKIITKQIITQVRQSRFKLLERLTDSVLAIIMDNKAITYATVRIDKPRALRFAKSVCVELSARR